MAELIKIVSGGYKVEETDKFIPATDIIPFGRFHEDNNAQIIKPHINLNEGDSLEEKDMQELRNRASQYADKMKAQYFELEKTVSVFPGKSFFGGVNMKDSIVAFGSRIQLYVVNPYRGESQDK